MLVENIPSSVPESASAPAPIAAPAPAPAPANDEFREIELISAPAPAAPVATPAPSPAESKSDEKPSDKGEDKGNAPDVDGDKARPKPSAQDRIDELTRARRSAEREAEYWRGRANEASTQKPKAEPQREAFENEADYVKEMSVWTVEQAKAVATNTTTEQMAQNAAINAWNSKVSAARESIPDYDAVMTKAELPVSNDVAAIIRGNSQGPVIAYELAKQPEVLEKVNGMNMADAAVEIGLLLAKRNAPAPSPIPQTPQRVTKAPDPLTEKANAGTAVPVSDPSNMSMEDYKNFRKGQGAWWAR